MTNIPLEARREKYITGQLKKPAILAWRSLS